ncbi:MAG TPA: 6-hydroxycyclohex-1-ene-1-carbonyl-CoA dehydrogenase [Acetobacteraceae bacterium]|nr:6-hydroxycyclohex-1-ene-1-carbonyl-CoA dehydrogenase [Acetobacteraceae bacterium]
MADTGFQWVMTAPDAPFTRRGFDPFPPGPGEVVVAVAGCGVCHTDLGYLHDGVRTNHPLPLTLGHEISGTVVAAGPGEEPWLGRAVIVPAVLPCGTCDHCRRGLPTICRSQKMPGNDIDGGFASHIRVPGRGLCPVDRGRLDAAGLTLADVSVVADAVTTPFQAVRRAGIAPGSVAIVVGIGGVGGYAAQIAHAFGATVVAIDIDEARLATMARHGAALTLDARAADARALKASITDFVAARGLRQTEWCIFECSGSAAGQRTAWSLLVPGATLAVVGFTMERVEVRLSNLMAFDARALGNWGCPPELYPDALDLVLDGRIALAPFVEQHRLDDINDVFADAHAHRLTRRAILVPAA